MPSANPCDWKCDRMKTTRTGCGALDGVTIAEPEALYSSASGWSAMFFSPAALFSL